MIGKPYMRYFPREVTRLESGLTIYEVFFLTQMARKAPSVDPIHPSLGSIG